MSKAEERAQEAYPTWRNGIGDEFSSNSAYYGFIEGYRQAEKDLTDKARLSSGWDGFYYGQGYEQAEEDLKLTIEDIKKIHTFLYAVKNNKQGAFTFTRLSDEKYQEVLKRFNELKKL